MTKRQAEKIEALELTLAHTTQERDRLQDVVYNYQDTYDKLCGEARQRDQIIFYARQFLSMVYKQTPRCM